MTSHRAQAGARTGTGADVSPRRAIHHRHGRSISSGTESQLQSVWADVTTKWQQIDLDGAPALFREVPYSGLIGMLRTDHGLFGVADCADKEELKVRMARLGPR